MNPVSIKLALIREKQEFQACVGLMHGTLKECQLHLDMLHPKEQSVYQHYHYDRRKASYLLGRLSAKQAILDLANIKTPKSIQIDTGVFQFPVVKCPEFSNIQVSISHCDAIGWSIAYPEAHPMGIDVEKIDITRRKDILSQLTHKEKTNLLNNYNNIAGYTALFSIKEALSKVIRTGMMLDFKFLEIDNIKVTEQTMECTFTHFGQYKAVAYFKNEYVFSIVLPKRTKTQLGLAWQMLEDVHEIVAK